MKTKQLGGRDGDRRFALVLDTGDDVTAVLREFAAATRMTGHFSGIGALREVTIAFWNPETKQYENTSIGEQMEVVALTGSIALGDRAPKVHAHIVLGGRDGHTRGGHLVSGIVRPTLELLFLESSVDLRRIKDDATGLALLAL